MEFILSMFARPLGILLQGLYSVVGNYAITLIILTTIVKLALYPSYKQQQMSSMGMQKIQPRMKDIQAKYANDRAKMNEKMQELYKEEGVNPTAGCLPMIVQMIIIMGLFALLRNPIMYMDSEAMVFAIHESFLWIEDMAQPDLWVLPILAGIATFLSFFLTAKSGAETPGMSGAMGKAMQFIFPVMIIWLARSYPAGLALYWFVSQFIQIFFTLRFNQLRKKADEKDKAKHKKKPVRAGGGV